MVTTRSARKMAPVSPEMDDAAALPVVSPQQPPKKKEKPRKRVEWETIAKKALGGGIPGAVAMVLQVILLMWLRTVVNYQMRNGGTIAETIAILYAEGGIPRFYAGMWAALFQSPLARFGDTAANAGILAALEHSSLPVPVQTLFASMGAALWRIFITPLDTVKTTLQVGGVEAYGKLLARIAAHGPFILWAGAAGNLVATFVGHYPWFATNNTLEAALPGAQNTSRRIKLLRRAGIGLCSSLVSDLASNSTRVLKTFVQTSEVPLGYLEAIRIIVSQRGLSGLFFSGLVTKMIANGISSIIFSILWKMMMDNRNPASEQQRGSMTTPKKSSSTSKKNKPHSK